MLRDIHYNLHNDNLISFFGGDIFATIITSTVMAEMDWLHPLLKLAFIALGGLFGGFFGLLGQKLFKWTEKTFLKK